MWMSVIESGTLTPNMPIKALDVHGNLVEEGRATKVFAFRGLERVAVDSAEAGEIVAIAGLIKATVSNTFADPEVTAPLHAREIDPPTLSMTFAVNDSPFAGRDGDKVQSRVIRERLLREAEGNVALRVVEASDKDSMEVSGRGELQLAILIETMRREGFELSVSRARVVLKKDETATKDELLKFMQGKIASWWMPDDVVFVDEIPHTATGKILKTVLRERFKDFVLPSAAATR